MQEVTEAHPKETLPTRTNCIGVCGGRETEEPRKTPQSKARANDKLDSLKGLGWWETNTLTTVPSLLNSTIGGKV